MKKDYVIRTAEDFAQRVVGEANDFIGIYLFSQGEEGLQISDVSHMNNYVLGRHLKQMAKNSPINEMVILSGVWKTDSSNWVRRNSWIPLIAEKYRKSGVLIYSNTPTDSVCYEYEVENYSLIKKSVCKNTGLYNNINRRTSKKA